MRIESWFVEIGLVVLEIKVFKGRQLLVASKYFLSFLI